ncbi:MAG: hypothetical protein M3Q42_01450 [Pseudomonadota bacterium]|nr:hypothetical protein [Pseudomonadota bacterium]
MRPAAIALAMMLLAGTAHAQGVPACSALGSPPVLAAQSTSPAPLSAEMASPTQQLGAPAGVLAQALDETMSVDQVLYRIRLSACSNLASAMPVPSPGGLPAAPVPALPVSPAATTLPDPTDPAVYKPKTEFDNTPWRFDMNQNGKRMTADEFTAWMEAKGVRVVKPRATVAAAPAPAAVADDQAPMSEPVAAPEPADTQPSEDAEPTP